MDRKHHWESVYSTKAPNEVSWYQAESRMSLDLVRRVEPRPSAAILDVGGGASTFVDGLLDVGYREVTVLDLSRSALEQSRARLGSRSDEVTWLEADILSADFPRPFDLWHDRAVFHFLTSSFARASYIDQVRRSLLPGGHILVATFANDGPTHCSGLEVDRYTPETLHGVFGEDFTLMTSAKEDHVTPWGVHQSFVYCMCRYLPRTLAQPAA